MRNETPVRATELGAVAPVLVADYGS